MLTKQPGQGVAVGTPFRMTAKRILRLVGPVLLIVVIIRIPDRRELVAAFSGAALLPLVGAVCLNALAILLKALRWQAVVRAGGLGCPFTVAWKGFSASLYLGMVTPGRMGDVVRVTYLPAGSRGSLGERIASVVVDRIFDLYVLVSFAAYGLFRIRAAAGDPLAGQGWLWVAPLLGAPLVMLVPGVLESVSARLPRPLLELTRRMGAAGFSRAFRRQMVRGAWAALPLTIVAFAVSFAQGWLVARALDVPLSMADVVAVIAVTSLLALLPITVAGVGVREAGLAVLFPMMGYDAAAGVAFGLLLFVVVYLALAVYGFVSWQLWPPRLMEGPTVGRASAIDESPP